MAEEPALARYRRREIHMGVPVDVTLYAADETTANRAADAIYRRFAELNSLLSDYDPKSELSRLSDTAGSGQSVRASDDLWRVLVASQKLSADSDGAFDVTVGPLVRLWRRARRMKEFPSADRLTEARTAVGYQAIHLDAERHTVRLERPGIRLDLGGIAMGYAVDQGLAAARALGVTRVLVDASGDIGAGDPPPGAAGWKLGVAPRGETREALRWVQLANAAVTTSGDAYQFVELNGQRYSHIVDPRTGLGLTTRASATVIARDCLTADSVATAVCVLGPERGLQFIEARPELAAIVTWVDDGGEHIRESTGFAKHTIPAPPAPK
ncbi:MAG: FAD:protein FMN transferase [Planctomycetes bacterium]|nr:FAD:protein FMN transferase [Planctomycetota bacterium]